MPDQASDEPATAPDMDLRQLVQRHQTGIWRYLRALGTSAQLAEELLQDTFVVAWQRGLSDHGDAPVATFLRRTARHLYLKHCRAQGRRDELLADAVDHLWQRTCDDDQGERWLIALRDCTQQLEGRAKTAVNLCYGPEAVRGGRDRAAKSLGLQPNGLKTLLQRVRAVLRECIENKLEGKR
tara:strand:- start:853 stop:1398 length:546 start_codon:yes stop_codon:yes gene_type:complete